MGLEFEDIQPWIDDAGDTGRTARLKLARNFAKIAAALAGVGHATLADVALIAQKLAEDSDDWAKILRKDKDDATPYSINIGKDLTVEGSSTLNGLTATTGVFSGALSAASAVIAGLITAGSLSTNAATISELNSSTIIATENVASPLFIGDLQGKLKTPRMIWGHSFDGSADINGTLINNIYGNNFNILQSLDGDDYLFGQYIEYKVNGNIIHRLRYDAHHIELFNNSSISVNTNGCIGINNSSPAYGLDISGTLHATGVTTLDSTLHTVGAAIFDNNLTASGLITANGGVHTTTLIATALSTLSDTYISGDAQLYARVMSPDFASQTKGWGITRAGAADFRNIYADELRVQAFTADISQALAGSDYLTKSVSKLSANFVIPAVGNTARVIVDDIEGMPATQCFVNGDYIRFRAFNRTAGLIVANAWGTVTLDTTYGIGGYLNGTQAYVFTCTATTGAGLTVYKGNEVLDYGTSGSGMIARTTLDAMGSPYEQIATWVSDPSNSDNYTVHARLGNLNGLSHCSGYGLYSDNVFLTNSILIGDLTKAGNYLSFDPVNGLVIKLGGTSVATTSDVSSSLSSANEYTDTAKNAAISTASSDATTKANAAQSNAISSANTTAQGYATTAQENAANDATTKANSALSSAQSYSDNNLTVAKSYTDTQVTIVNGSISAAITTTRTYADNAASNAQTNAINSASVDATNKVNSIQVGGTNLRSINGAMGDWTIGGSSGSYTNNYSSGYQYTNATRLQCVGAWQYRFYLTHVISKAGYYSLSFWYKCLSSCGACSPQINDKILGTTIDQSTDWKFFSSFIYVDSLIGEYGFIDFEFSDTSDILISDLVIIEGNKPALTYITSPEDVTNAISTAQSNAVSQAATNAAALYVTQSVYSAQVNILTDSISAKVSQSDFNALGTRVSAAETNITQQSSSITAQATSISDLTGRMSTAEAKITSDAINLTVLSQTQNYADTAQSNAVSQAATNAAALYVTQSVYSAQVSILTDSILSKVSQTDFNALGTRVGTAESNITQNTTNINLKVSKDSIISSINQTAESVTINASKINLTSAVTFSSLDSSTQSTINGKADTSTVNTQVNNAINVASVDATNKVNSIQVGGTNLLLNSQEAFIQAGDYPAYFTTVNTLVDGFYESIVTSTQSDDIRSYSYGWFYDRIASFPITNQDYMLSFDYKTNNSTGFIRLDIRDADNNNAITFSTGPLPNTNGVWVRGYFKCNWTITSQTRMLLLVNAGATINDYVGIRKIKWEIGNKATAYSPAPQDVSSDITAAKNDAINTASADATTKANSAYTGAVATASASTAALYVAKTEYSADLTITNSSISAKVSKTDYDSNNTVISNHFSTVEQTASGISTRVTTAQSTADTIQTDLTNYKSTVASTYSTITQTSNSIAVAISSVETYADNSASTAQSNAISTAASDATTKSNSALSSAKSYTDTQITAVNGTISLQVTSVKTYADNAASTAQSNAISAAAGDATSKANSAYNNAVSYTDSKITVTEGKITATVNTAISNVQVGGRNYATGTSDLTTWTIESTSILVTVSDGYTQILNPSNAGHYGIYQDISVQPNTQYTISFDYISSGGGYALGGTSSNAFWGLSGYIDLTGSGKVNTTYTTNSNQTYIRVYLWGNNANSYLKVKTKSLKLEKGNKATDWSPAPEDVDASISSKVSQSAYDANNVLIANQFTEIKQTSDSISLKVNSDGFVNSYPLSVYGKVTKGTYYTFGIGQDGEFAAVCSTLTGLIVGKKYVAKVTLKNIDCVNGATLDTYLSASVPTLSSYNDTEDYEVTDYNDLGEIYIEFTATASTMYVGFITGSDGWTNNTGGYCHIDIHNISLFYDNVKNKLLSVGIDIDNNKITETADTLLIRDSSGNVNTIFDTINGKPVVRSQYIQTQDLDVSGTFSERYSFVNRGTLNIINFSTLNNIAVNRGIDPTPAVVVLPMYTAYTGGNFNTVAFQKAGTNISIQNSYNVNMKNWKEAAILLNGSGKASLRYQLAASAVIIVSDPRIIAYNNYVGSTPLIYPDGQANANDSIEYRKGRMFCNGKSARIAMILPGQTLRLQSGIETYNGTSYLVWYVVNAAEYTAINKGIAITKDGNDMFGSSDAGTLAFHATNTYSNWGEGGTYDTDFLIAPKELDAWVGGQAYASEDPSIVLDCSDPESDTLFYINER